MNSQSGDTGRAGDAARLLPIFGVFLLMPPIVSLFAVDSTIGGVPVIVVYLFCAWLALIVCAAFVARRLRPACDDDPGDADERNR